MGPEAIDTSALCAAYSRVFQVAVLQRANIQTPTPAEELAPCNAQLMQKLLD